MSLILEKEYLNGKTVRIKIAAPVISRKAGPGQFVLVRADETSERVPFTISTCDREDGTISIIFQIVGKSTVKLSQLSEGDEILDVLGPLGEVTELLGYDRAMIIGGGLGTAIAYPYAKYLHSAGTRVDAVMGFRNKELIILQDEIVACSDTLEIITDDGSNGKRGYVTTILEQRLQSGVPYDLVIAIGPLIMMKAVSEMTREYGVKTIVSLNPIMIDGTGMCGGCRVCVGGEIKFACVDGPDFDGHLVDFDSLLIKNRAYDNNHKCRIGGGLVK